MSLAETMALARVVVEKELTLLRRYWVNTASGILSSYVMFLLVFFGGRTVGGVALEDSLGGVIVAFFLWSLSWSAFTGPANSLRQEAEWGTLEQLHASPLGLRRVLALDVLVSLGVGLFTSLLFLGAMLLTTGTALAVDLPTVVPLVALTMCSAVGLGFAAGGLALVYKRIGNAFLLVQFGLLGALAAPSGLPYQALPLAYGNDLLRVAMSDGVRLWEFSSLAVGALVLKAIASLAVGGLVFGLAVRSARRRGVLGHY